MKKIAGAALALTAGTLLAGCQGPILKGWGFAKKAPPEAAAPRDDASDALAQGRAMLRAGQLSGAVAQFRIARMDADHAADANNGLGVAFAKLGRMDLADRYFRLAIALNPADDRYAANLLRLRHAGAMLARRAETARESASLARVAEGANAVATAGASAPPARRSPVMHIATRSELGAAPRMAVVANPSAVSKIAGNSPVEPASETAPPAAEPATVAKAEPAVPTPLEIFFKR